METNEGTSRLNGTAYDGFISYSHAADGLLAPRLQSALQRFAKPWWKRRAVRIFRDESSLSANPHLWSSITEALDTSGWFVLLLSPDAVESEWVNQEISYWVEHRDRKKILPVVTDGEFGWADDVMTGSAVPEALQGVFTEEPRWVDLRFAKGEEQLDLQNPTFSAAIADIASAIRGVPKDELESEEVRQHRRTVRTAWAGGALVSVLAGAAIGFGISSGRNAQEAERLAQAESQARAEAETNRAAEAAARILAEENAQAAIAAQLEAEEQAARADRTARRLIDFVFDEEFTEVDPPPRGALPVGLQPTGLTVMDAPPVNVRLDFLQDHCVAGVCARTAGFIDDERQLRTGQNPWNNPSRPLWGDGSGWLAGEPFHIRHGFPNLSGASTEELLANKYFVLLYVRRETGPEVATFEFGRTYLFFSGTLVREEARACGREYREFAAPVLCDRWVFDFPDGLPPGKYDLWIEWVAPCSAWLESNICPSPSQPMSLVASGVSMNFFDETYLVGGSAGVATWPFDPWDYSEPIPEASS